MNELEYNKVYKVYDKIAEHFSQTRVIIWPKVEEFIENIKSGSIILDLGCGNSKNMGQRKDCKYIGLDICEKLLKECKKNKNCEYIVGNCINVPLKNECVDYIMSIAVIHHLSTKDKREKSIEEISRLLKKGGRGLIYVWAYEQKKFKNEKEQDVLVKWNLQKKYNNNEEDIVLERYYHLFIKNELENLIKNVKKIKIIENGIQCNNYYCIIEKI